MVTETKYNVGIEVNNLEFNLIRSQEIYVVGLHWSNYVCTLKWVFIFPTLKEIKTIVKTPLRGFNEIFASVGRPNMLIIPKLRQSSISFYFNQTFCAR